MAEILSEDKDKKAPEGADPLMDRKAASFT